MENFLVIDSGGTKADWCWSKDGEIKKGSLNGIHPNFLNEEQIGLLLEEIPINYTEHFDAIFFYGAGCGNQKNINKITNCLTGRFISDNIEVNHDLLGAARACYGNDKGLVLILGTGSVGAYYDGKKIKEIVGGLGFLYGDEGSGAHLGKLIISKWLQNELPNDLASKFQQYLKMDKNETITKTYLNRRPNQFLASVTPFILKHAKEKAIEKIISESLDALDTKLISPLLEKETSNNEIRCVGGVAFHFKKQINAYFKEKNISFEMIEKPIDKLIFYHSSKS